MPALGPERAKPIPTFGVPGDLRAQGSKMPRLLVLVFALSYGCGLLRGLILRRRRGAGRGSVVLGAIEATHANGRDSAIGYPCVRIVAGYGGSQRPKSRQLTGSGIEATPDQGAKWNIRPGQNRVDKSRPFYGDRASRSRAVTSLTRSYTSSRVETVEARGINQQ
jgi:hypothetical protein